MINDQSLKNEMFPLFVHLLRAYFEIYYFSHLPTNTAAYSRCIVALAINYQEVGKFLQFFETNMYVGVNSRNFLLSLYTVHILSFDADWRTKLFKKHKSS